MISQWKIGINILAALLLWLLLIKAWKTSLLWLKGIFRWNEGNIGIIVFSSWPWRLNLQSACTCRRWACWGCSYSCCRPRLSGHGWKPRLSHCSLRTWRPWSRSWSFGRVSWACAFPFRFRGWGGWGLCSSSTKIRKYFNSPATWLPYKALNNSLTNKKQRQQKAHI